MKHNPLINAQDENAESKGIAFYRATKISEKHVSALSPDVKKILKMGVHYKTYGRLPRIDLPIPFRNKALSFFRKRTSKRDLTKPLSKKDLSSLLFYGAGTTETFGNSFLHRTYPSGGARYPIELYVAVQNAKGIPQGVYHYDLTTHGLNALSGAEDARRIVNALSDPQFREASCILIMTAVFKRNTIKYGDRGFRHIFFECGHIAQNINLLATYFRINVCGVGGFVEDEIIDALDIDEGSEIPLYVIGLGGSSH